MLKKNRISGQAAVEYALILPLVVTVILAGTDLYLAASQRQRLAFTAKECALYCALSMGSREEPEIICRASELSRDNPGVRLSVRFEGDSVLVSASQEFVPVSFAGRILFGASRTMCVSCTASQPVRREIADD